VIGIKSLSFYREVFVGIQMLEDFKIRFAQIEDVPLILEFIKELADYEKMLDEVTATEEILEKSLFERKRAEVIIGEYKGTPVSFALFFPQLFNFFRKRGHLLRRFICKTPYAGKRHREDDAFIPSEALY